METFIQDILIHELKKLKPKTMALTLNNNNNNDNNSNNENFIILKQYYIYNYTPLYLKVVHNWLVCYQKRKINN